MGGEKWLPLVRGVQECTHTPALFCYCSVWINRMQLVWRRHMQHLFFSPTAEIGLGLSNLGCEGKKYLISFAFKVWLLGKFISYIFSFLFSKLFVIICIHFLPKCVLSHSSCVTDLNSFLWPEFSLLFLSSFFIFKLKFAMQKCRIVWYNMPGSLIACIFKYYRDI